VADGRKSGVPGRATSSEAFRSTHMFLFQILKKKFKLFLYSAHFFLSVLHHAQMLHFVTFSQTIVLPASNECNAQSTS
jgi:hypothetical protein